MLNFQERDERRHFVHKKLIGFVSDFIPGGGIVKTGLGIIGKIKSRSAKKDIARASKFTPELAQIHLVRHGHTRASSGHGWLSPQLAAAAGTLPALGPKQLTASLAAQEISAAMRGRRFSPAFLAPPIQAPVGTGPGGDCPGVLWVKTDTGCVNLATGETQPRSNGTGGGGGGTAPGSPGGPPAGSKVVSPEVFQDSSTRSGVRLRCPARYKLGIDNMCYFNLPRNSKWRKWRPGRRPLFTGGDLNAINLANSLSDDAEEIFKKTNPAKKAVARNYRASWRKPLKK